MTEIASRQRTMKAVRQDRYGAPDVLRLADVAVPAIGPGEVLLQVRAASLNPHDWHVVRGDPKIIRLLGYGVRRPKEPVAGIDAAGVVVAVGPDVRELEPGDEVLGVCRGAFAEFAAADADLVVRKPRRLSFEEAATLPTAASTAFRALGAVGRAQPGQRVLVNGAAGGVGGFAVQLAADLGAHVTGVCGPGNTEYVRSLGAADVVDYTDQDFTDGTRRWDLILDNVGNHSLRRLRRALTPTGTLVVNGGGSPGQVIGMVAPIVRAGLLDRVTRQHLRPLLATKSRDDLLAVTALAGEGRLRPNLGPCYRLEQVAEGLARLEQGHTRGKAVIMVG